MEKAKAAVSDFMSKSGKHDTTVHEKVNPHVQHETVNEQREERRQVATDREVHQDHYHTSVQPVQDREVLPEQHHHNMVPVEHRTHDHRDHDRTHNTLQQEAAQFQDKSVRAPVQHQSTAVPTVQGEHVHHHVHETIQPVVQKETIEPHVVHTTVPIHEVHHNREQHHAASALPAVSMADFKKGGGSLIGRDERVDHFSGEPRNIEQAFGQGSGAHGLTGGSSGGHGEKSMTGAGLSTGSGATGTGHSSHLHDGAGLGHNTGSNTVGRDSGIGHSNELGHNNSSTGALGSSTGTAGTTQHKPSLMDKLNPMKDSDGDGKKGVMK